MVHLTVELVDHVTIFDLNATVVEVKQCREENRLHLTYFTYVILVTRNDGLQWIIERRYSEFAALKQRLKAMEPMNVFLVQFSLKFYLNLLGKSNHFPKERSSEVHE